MRTFHPRLAVSGLAAVVPGVGEVGRRFGELVGTDELLTRIRPVYPKSDRPVEADWVRQYLGIRSVAVGRSTLDLCRRLWADGLDTSAAFAVCQTFFNAALYHMLGEAVRAAVAQRPDVRVVAHLHIGSGMHQFIEDRLHRIRRASGVSEPGVCTLILQQGCAGVLAAVEAADALLGDSPDPARQVLVTAENNMIVTAHLRARHRPPGNSDYNYWLWPAVFGEGAGAMLLGRPTGDARWRVTAAGVEVLADGESVVGPVGESGADGYQVMLNAKQVRQNYLAGVPRHAELAVAALGGAGRLHRLCLHESNPLLVEQVARQLGVPAERVPTHSAEVGTLASVSAFTLLGEALSAPPEGAADGIACSLIGEAGGHLLAGHLCLRRGG